MTESVQNIYEDMGYEVKPSRDKLRMVIIREREGENYSGDLKRLVPREKNKAKSTKRE